jgi:GT2 family glycosyltransferase
LAFNVVIATYKRPKMLQRTLTSLEQAERPSGALRIIVVENGERAGAEEICTASPLPVEYQFVQQAGSGRARQHALDLVSEGFMLFLDDDVRVSPNLLVEYERAVERNGPNAFYGGPIVAECEQPPPDWLRQFLPPSVIGWDSENSWPWFLGANYGAFAEAIRKVGGLSLTLGPGALRPGTGGNPTGLETELQTRLVAAGYKQVYVPDATVWHFVEAESCTPEWALHRRYRNAMSKALREDAWYKDRLSFMGVPMWMYGRLLKSFGRTAILALAGDPTDRFRSRYELQGWRGRIGGARLRARQGA